MKQFRYDNTDGYDEFQLAELNTRLEKELKKSGHDPDTDDAFILSAIDHIAERVLADYDTELAI